MKEINRRSFVKLLLGASALGTVGSLKTAEAMPSGYGKLVDTTICIGCKRCMSACKRWNDLEVDRLLEITDRETDLSPEDFTVVNLRSDAKNRAERTYVKWQCQHCRKPACAGACPVTAIRKLPEGPVVINEEKCIGCMYCYQSCPYKIPRFSFKKRVARKCTLCYDRISLAERLKPACVDACPVEAITFDYKDTIIRNAKKRVEELGRSANLLGLEEAGGTDVLTISYARAQDLDLIIAPKKVVNQNLDKIRIIASGFMGASGLVGLLYILAAWTNTEENTDHERHA